MYDVPSLFSLQTFEETKEKMQERLKIINLNSVQDGCSYVRHKVPFEALRSRGHYVQMTFPIYRNDFQFAVLSRAHSEQLGETLIKMKMAGMKIVYDTDDLLFELEPENPYSSHSGSIKGSVLAKRCMSLVDVVTCTTPALAMELQKYTKAPIRVLPNCINPKHWTSRPHEKRNTVRVGYAGSISHLKELLFLIPIIRELKKKYNIEFHLFGVFDSLKQLENDCTKKIEGSPIWQKLGNQVLKELQTIEYVHYPYVAIDKYPAMLASLDLDIGLCPLFQSRFNDCKSNIKFLEYAMVGTAPVCADVLPYLDCPNRLPMDPKAWKDCIEHLILDENARKVWEKEAWFLATEDYTIEKNVHRWEEVYFEALQKRLTIQRVQAGISQERMQYA